MHDTDPTTTKQIAGFTIVLPPSYAPGHICTPGEAAVLTNARNRAFAVNVARRLNAAVETGDLDPGDDAANATAQRIADDYAASWSVGSRPEAAPEPGPVEAEFLASVHRYAVAAWRRDNPGVRKHDEDAIKAIEHAIQHSEEPTYSLIRTRLYRAASLTVGEEGAAG